MKRILTAVLALTIMGAAPMAAMADDDRGRGKKHGHHKHGKHERGGRDGDDRDERRAYRQGYQDGRRADGGYHQRPYVYVEPRGYAPVWRRATSSPTSTAAR
jgi:Ni/Co efflux regulator RcnB